jgi:hypothetical protein
MYQGCHQCDLCHATVVLYRYPQQHHYQDCCFAAALQNLLMLLN